MYSASQLEQIRDQIMRVSQSSMSKKSVADVALDEDEEFKIAEQLASSFNLTQDGESMNKQEYSQALQKSYRQLIDEEKAKINQSETGRSINNESLSYSITQSSQPPSTMIGATSSDAKSSLVPSSTMRSDDQLVSSVSRSQMPDFLNDKNRQNELEEQAAGAGQARHFYYAADEQVMSVASKDFDDVYDVSGQSQILRDLRQSATVPNNQSMVSSSAARGPGQQTFGKDDD